MADTDKNKETVEEEIWALEKAYFTNLYQADYEAVLAIVHVHFLGWPGTEPGPLDRDGSARFMREYIPQPTSCAFMIERVGIRMLEDVALTQYTLFVDCSDIPDGPKTKISRITHTWVRESECWKLLGGMSWDL